MAASNRTIQDVCPKVVHGDGKPPLVVMKGGGGGGGGAGYLIGQPHFCAEICGIHWQGVEPPSLLIWSLVCTFWACVICYVQT